MSQNKELNRQSIRLKGYDYSQSGFYFITICVRNRECIFGEIKDGIMLLNEYGNVTQRFWNQIGDRFHNVHQDAFVVMPNHVHAIIEIKSVRTSVGAIHELPLRIVNHEQSKKQRRKMLIPKIVGWYKMNTAKRINTKLDKTGTPFWQRNYYEHIIRNEESLHRIRQYIDENPERWDEDRFHIEK